MNHSFLFLIVIFLIPATFAKNKSCRVVFEKPVLSSRDNPRVYLTSIGLKEGVDPFGNKDRSIMIVNERHSFQSRVLKEFTELWPDIKIHYLLEETYISGPNARMQYLLGEPYTPGPSPKRMRTLVRMGQNVVALMIPLKTLQDPTILITHLVGVNESLQKIEVLKKEKVEYFLEALTSEAFTLHIDHIPKEVQHPYLKMLRNRMETYGTKFSFTGSALSPHFQNVMGQATGNLIEISSSLFLSLEPQSRSTLAHELMHTSSHQRAQNRGDVGRQIWFKAGAFNAKGLVAAEFYNRKFQSDEVEAWYVTERMEGTPLEQSVVPQFLYTQIEWLQHLRDELPHYLSQSEKEYDLHLKYQTRHLGHKVTPLAAEESPNFEFRVYENTVNEVIVSVQRVPEKIKQLGKQKFLEEVLDRRLRQLKHRALVLEKSFQ